MKPGNKLKIAKTLGVQNLSRDVNDWMLQIIRFFHYCCSYSAKKKIHFQLTSPVSSMPIKELLNRH
jgi:hypothetical protein